MNSDSHFVDSKNFREFIGKSITILYIKIGSVCLCHGQHAIGDCRYFLAPCDNRPPATPARIPLADTLCGYRTVVSVSSTLYDIGLQLLGVRDDS